MTLSIELQSATFADLAALVEAAQAADVDDNATIRLEHSTLLIEVDTHDRVPARPEEKKRDSGAHANPGTSALGDAAARSILDILNNHLEPPR